MSQRAIRKIIVAVALCAAAAASPEARAQWADCTGWDGSDPNQCYECWRTVYSDRAWRTVYVCSIPRTAPRYRGGYRR
jgi:hypothetical protein